MHSLDRPESPFPARPALLMLALVTLFGCESGTAPGPGGGPAPAEALEGRYYNFAVELTWELSSQWDGEPFRVYGKRVTDSDYFLIAEVTSCADGFCLYVDLNVTPEESYEYEVVAVDPDGVESAARRVGPIGVPEPTAPPVPGDVEAVGLDGTLYLEWGLQSRGGSEDDFAFYRVYLEGADGTGILLGETDSEGFVDLLVENGETYGYFVTAVDTQGHESTGSELAEATPRPDFSGELLIAFQDLPSESGFVFRESETLNPIVPGDSSERHFRFETDQGGWRLVPGPGVEVHTEPEFTSALRCGVGADASCTDLSVAPSTGYSSAPVEPIPEFSYVFRVPASGGGWRYGVVRITQTGVTQAGAVILFDWAWQLQVDNRNLVPPAGGS